MDIFRDSSKYRNKKFKKRNRENRTSFNRYKKIKRNTRSLLKKEKTNER